MMKKLMYIFALMLVPLQSPAAIAWVELNVTAFRSNDDPTSHILFFDPIAADADPNNCGNLTSASYPIANDWKTFDSMVLAALLADKMLRVRFAGCNGSRPEIDYMEIRK